MPKTSWSQKVWCNKPTKLQLQSILIRKIWMLFRCSQNAINIRQILRYKFNGGNLKSKILYRSVYNIWNFYEQTEYPWFTLIYVSNPCDCYILTIMQNYCDMVKSFVCTLFVLDGFTVWIYWRYLPSKTQNLRNIYTRFISSRASVK